MKHRHRNYISYYLIFVLGRIVDFEFFGSVSNIKRMYILIDYRENGWPMNADLVMFWIIEMVTKWKIKKNYDILCILMVLDSLCVSTTIRFACDKTILFDFCHVDHREWICNQIDIIEKNSFVRSVAQVLCGRIVLPCKGNRDIRQNRRWIRFWRDKALVDFN